MTATAHISRNVCTELAAAISDYEWSEPFESIAASYRRTPDYGLEDLGSLKVSVVPGPVAINQTDRQPRGGDHFDVTVGIVLAKHVSSEQEVSDLEDLNMAIIDAIRSYKITLETITYADWTEIAVPMPFDPQALNDRSVFLSQTEITFMVPLDKLS